MELETSDFTGKTLQAWRGHTINLTLWKICLATHGWQTGGPADDWGRVSSAREQSYQTPFWARPTNKSSRIRSGYEGSYKTPETESLGVWQFISRYVSQVCLFKNYTSIHVVHVDDFHMTYQSNLNRTAPLSSVRNFCFHSSRFVLSRRAFCIPHVSSKCPNWDLVPEN